MVIEKKLNQETKTIADAARLMEQNKRVVDDARYYSALRRSQRSSITKPKEEARKEPTKEPYVVVKGFDPVIGKMTAEDKSTGKVFPVEILSDGPLALDSRVMGFPPGPGEKKGYIRGPMKGPPVPPLEAVKKPKKKEEEIDVWELRYTMRIAFISPEGKPQPDLM